jgi:hypothetical protein
MSPHLEFIPCRPSVHPPSSPAILPLSAIIGGIHFTGNITLVEGFAAGCHPIGEIPKNWGPGIVTVCQTTISNIIMGIVLQNPGHRLYLLPSFHLRFQAVIRVPLGSYR